MLEYTGHPLVDVGIATITAFANKWDPAQLTEVDLDKIADYITREYVRQPLRSFLTVAFPNSGFTQPAYNKQPEKRQIYAENVLRAYRSNMPKSQEHGVFTNDFAAAISFDVKGELPLGRAFRQHIPLLSGEKVINFFPYGEAGLPVSGAAMLALQAFPLGCAKSGGRLLAVHSDNSEIILHFAKTFLRQNREAINLAQLAGSTKMPEAQFAQRTLLIDVLLRAKSMQREAHEDEQLFSITAYHLTNSGQGADLDIYHLPMEVVGFLGDMQTPDYNMAWNGIVRRAWEVPPKTKKRTKTSKPFQPRRNWLYEDLFDLQDNPANARKFLRTYFLRLAVRYARGKTDPRVDYSLQNEADLVSWKVTARFLRRIMHMEAERIEQIRAMGDRLADYVSSQNDRRFFRQFFVEQRYSYFRTALIKANLAYVKRGHPPIITFDPYIEVFEEGNDLASPDWRLARDLVLIRMVEQLYQQGWLGSNTDAIPEADTAETESD